MIADEHLRQVVEQYGVPLMADERLASLVFRLLHPPDVGKQ